jgi:hypothetical protein
MADRCRTGYIRIEKLAIELNFRNRECLPARFG